MPIIVSDIIETREIASVLLDQRTCEVAPTPHTPEALTKAVEELIAGKRFAIGQVVYFKSVFDAIGIGSVPAIVTRKTKKSSTEHVYDFRLLLGDIAVDNVIISISDTLTANLITPEKDLETAFNTIFDSKLGKTDLPTMFSSLGVDKLMYLNNDTKKFISRL